MSTGNKLTIIALVLLIADQCVKFWIKTSFTLGEEFSVFGWFRLLFVENPGMAFGMKFGDGSAGKIFLTLFRVIASGAILWYIFKLIKRGTPFGVLLCFTMIFCGAIGNLIDSLFYGLIFSASTHYELAQFLPAAGGYGSFLCGKVVDMLYFPIIETDNFVFFRPVFNFADSYISVGAVILILFYRDFFTTKKEDEQQ